MKDNNSLAHSTWNCKYHLVFAPKYRRMQIYGQIRKDIIEYIDYYNNKRIKDKLKGMSPVNYRIHSLAIA